jgi:aminoglycoside phosphotransferase (APT) family kinase protein
LKLIDFEFAAPNDPAFDLATWCLAFHIEPEDPILDAYGRREQRLSSRVRAYMPVVDALWSLYCCFMALRLSGNARATALLQMNTRILRMTGGELTPADVLAKALTLPALRNKSRGQRSARIAALPSLSEAPA